MHNLRYKTTLENKACPFFYCSPKFGLPMPFFLSPSSWTFSLRQGSSSSLLIFPGLLRSDRGGLSVSSPSGEREDACSLRRWRKFPALEFYSASFFHWTSSLSYPYFTTLYILNKRLIKQLFPDFRRRCPRFKFPGSTGAGPRQGSVDQNHSPPKKEMQQGKLVVWGDLTNKWEKKRCERQRTKEKNIPSWMQSFGEKQGGIRNPS